MQSRLLCILLQSDVGITLSSCLLDIDVGDIGGILNSCLFCLEQLQLLSLCTVASWGRNVAHIEWACLDLRLFLHLLDFSDRQFSLGSDEGGVALCSLDNIVITKVQLAWCNFWCSFIFPDSPIRVVCVLCWSAARFGLRDCNVGIIG